MPFNLTKRYNSLLELDGLNTVARRKSLEGIFNRDFIHSSVLFRGRTVEPTPKDGKDKLEILFEHLTTKTENKDTNHREYDRDRSMRIHWVKHHIMELRREVLDIFSVNDKGCIRTYIYDEKEKYVIILEPKSNDHYYLITAYYLQGGNAIKIERKGRRRLPKIY